MPIPPSSSWLLAAASSLLALSACDGITVHGPPYEPSPFFTLRVHGFLWEGQSISEPGKDGLMHLSTSLDKPVDVTVVYDSASFTSVETFVGVQRRDI